MRFTLAFTVLLAGCPAAPPVDAVIVSFTLSPETMAAGESAVLTWQASPANAGCTIDPDVGTVSGTGMRTVTPEASATYSLTCGATSRNAHVEVKTPVTIDTFTSTPAGTYPDGVISLHWSARGARDCAIDHDVGEVTPQGERDVVMSQTTTFTLSCDGYRGPALSKVTVPVEVPTSLPAPTQLAFRPYDGAVALSWHQPGGGSTVYFAEAPGVDASTVSTLPGGMIFRAVKSPFLVSGLINGKTYFARVSAVSGLIESALSDEASGAPAAAAPQDDPYFGEQWHLVNTGQERGTAGEDLHVAKTWADGKGEGVRVAIVDEGIDQNHEDLWQNVAPQASYDYLGNAALKLAEHGTCVAGLVAARDLNGKGVRGVAPRANVVSYNVLQDLTSLNQRDAMQRGLERNGASNNSWGDEDNTGLLTSPDPLWLAGVKNGVTNGRQGKGVVYLWAAGNGGEPPYVDNSNYDGQANSRYVFAVGGVGDDGIKATYSEDGANVLIATPTEGRATHALTTTDITGSLGYNDGFTSNEHVDPNYSKTMNGTSGATPEAAGVVALVLQANPALTWRDVRRILAMTARKNDPTDPGWAVNGAGLHVNHQYGFGVIDASAAVALAKTFTAGAVERSWSSPETTVNLPVPDDVDTGVSNAIVVNNSGVGHVEFVEITVTAPHDRLGDLRIELSHSGGASSQLHVPHDCIPDDKTQQEVCSVLNGYTFGSVRHLDEPGDGTWSLRLADTKAGHVGTFASWQLTLWGRP